MIFDRNEYRRRVERVRESLWRREIDILVDSDPANMNYLTGYDGWSFYVPQAVIVTLKEEEPIWVGRGIDAGGARLTTYLSENNIRAYPDLLVQNAERHPMEFVAAELAGRGLGGKVIATERDCYYFTPRCQEALRAGLPNAKFVDGGQLVNWVRLHKSEAELAAITEAARITEHIMTVFFDVVAPGVRQCDAAAEIFRAQVGGTATIGGDYAAAVPFLPTGSGTAAAHLTWSDQPFVAGETTFLEVAGVRHRYHCPMSRTLHLGRPPQKLRDANAAILEGIEEALQVAKTGNTCEDVEAAWRRAFQRHGLTKESRIGYSTGIGYPPDWGEHTASLRAGDRTELQPDMVFHLICGHWVDGWGMSISETFRVTDRGGAPIASVPRGLHVKE